MVNCQLSLNYTIKLQNMINQENYRDHITSIPPSNYKLQSHKTNGVSNGLSRFQISTYVLFLTQMTVYWACVFPLDYQIGLLVSYMLSGVILVIASAHATFTNPTDWIVYYYKNSQLVQEKIKKGDEVSDAQNRLTFEYDYKELRFCGFCDSYCSKTSKHCRQCNRCVQQLDHHCLWFNNCVGSVNYQSFFVSILSVFVHLGIFIAHAVLLTVKLEASQISNGTETLVLENHLDRLIPIWVVSIILVVFEILVLNLIGLHLYLISENITTYELLTKSKEEIEKIKEKRRQKKVFRKSSKVDNSQNSNSKKRKFSKQNQVSVSQKINLENNNQILYEQSLAHLSSVLQKKEKQGQSLDFKKRQRENSGQNSNLQLRRKPNKKLLLTPIEVKVEQNEKEKPEKTHQGKQQTRRQIKELPKQIEQESLSDPGQSNKQNNESVNQNELQLQLEGLNDEYRTQDMNEQNRSRPLDEESSQKTVKRRPRVNTIIAITRRAKEKLPQHLKKQSTHQSRGTGESTRMQAFFRRNTGLNFFVSDSMRQVASPTKINQFKDFNRTRDAKDCILEMEHKIEMFRE